MKIFFAGNGILSQEREKEVLLLNRNDFILTLAIYKDSRP
jgi:hypothetical protein